MFLINSTILFILYKQTRLFAIVQQATYDCSKSIEWMENIQFEAKFLLELIMTVTLVSIFLMRTTVVIPVCNSQRHVIRHV